MIDGNIVIEDQDVGEWGLTMTDAAADVDPHPSLAICGDLAPIDFDPNTAGVQTQTDSLGNIKTDPNTPDTDQDDTLYDSAGNDYIYASDGDATNDSDWRVAA